MRGRVLSFEDATGEGMISGDDGTRYPFSRGDLRGGALMVWPGAEVDFETANGRAVNVYALAVPNDKNRIAAALLAFFLGTVGIHKFYLGRTGAGVTMLLCGTIGWILVLPGMAMWAIALIEFVIYLMKSDQQFHQDYVVGKRAWF